jgi:SAM-dependent methyltransferase
MTRLLSPIVSHQAARGCPLSGSREAFIVSRRARDGSPLSNVVSASTGLVFVAPLPFADASSFYKEDYRRLYKGVVQPRKKHVLRSGRYALERLGRIQRHLGAGPVLDAGSGGGEFVYLLNARGIPAEGIEPNAGYARYASDELGLNIRVAMFHEVDLAPGRFSAITLFHVLEHLEDPVAELVRLRTALKPGGHLLVEVPSIVFPGMRFSEKWHAGHLNGFTARTLAAAGELAGLEVVSSNGIDDGGNLLACFRHSGKVRPRAQVLAGLTGHADEVLRALARNTVDYWNRPSTYVRPLRKVVRSLDEVIRATWSGRTRRELLEGLYRAGTRERSGERVGALALSDRP